MRRRRRSKRACLRHSRRSGRLRGRYLCTRSSSTGSLSWKRFFRRRRSAPRLPDSMPICLPSRAISFRVVPYLRACIISNSARGLSPRSPCFQVPFPTLAQAGCRSGLQQKLLAANTLHRLALSSGNLTCSSFETRLLLLQDKASERVQEHDGVVQAETRSVLALTLVPLGPLTSSSSCEPSDPLTLCNRSAQLASEPRTARYQTLARVHHFRTQARRPVSSAARIRFQMRDDHTAGLYGIDRSFRVGAEQGATSSS